MAVSDNKALTFEEGLYPSDRGMSPSFALSRFESMVKKYGAAMVLESIKFQKAREVWATSTFLLGLSTITSKEYWVAPEYRESTPDTYGFSVGQHPTHARGKLLEQISIEVAEWERHGARDLVGAIHQKLELKRYPSHFVLLIYVRRPGESEDLEEVFQRLRSEKQNICIREIWLLSSIMGMRDDSHALVRLFPEKAKAQFFLEDEKRKSAFQKEMVRFLRGSGDDCILDDTFYIPLPELPKSPL